MYTAHDLTSPEPLNIAMTLIIRYHWIPHVLASDSSNSTKSYTGTCVKKGVHNQSILADLAQVNANITRMSLEPKTFLLRK